MGSLKVLLSVLCIATTLTRAVVATQAQVPFSQPRPASTTVADIGINSLSALPADDFVTISHPHFPRHSARIKKTEGFCDENVNAYTGYIDVGTRHLFFYFFESRNDPDNDDVVFWTNGGPGGSSALGLFMELGPCRIVSENATKSNPYSWNNNANIFFIDQPAGVGLSYADFGEVISTTEEVAKDIAAFVSIFFETFDKFKGRGFHLSGESYGGRYLPVYASEIYDQNARLKEAGLTPINLKSVLIGNGATDFRYLYSSYYDFQCSGSPLAIPQTISTCVRMQKAVTRCLKWTQESCVDVWDHMNCAAAHQFCEEELILPYINLGLNAYDGSMACDNLDCYPENQWTEVYLNNETIRQNLGVDPAVGNFSAINWALNSAFTDAGDMFHPTQPYVAELLHRGVRVLIYVGDWDFVCNAIGNERWTLDMEWAGQEGFRAQPLRDWFIEDKPVGKVRPFGNLTFLTVSGGGHLLPHDKPVESLEMLNRWLTIKDF